MHILFVSLEDCRGKGGNYATITAVNNIRMHTFLLPRINCFFFFSAFNRDIRYLLFVCRLSLDLICEKLESALGPIISKNILSFYIFMGCTLSARIGGERRNKNETACVTTLTQTSRSSPISIACDYIASESLFLMYIFTAILFLTYYARH